MNFHRKRSENLETTSAADAKSFFSKTTLNKLAFMINFNLKQCSCMSTSDFAIIKIKLHGSLIRNCILKRLRAVFD